MIAFDWSPKPIKSCQNQIQLDIRFQRVYKEKKWNRRSAGSSSQRRQRHLLTSFSSNGTGQRPANDCGAALLDRGRGHGGQRPGADRVEHLRPVAALFRPRLRHPLPAAGARRLLAAPLQQVRLPQLLHRRTRPARPRFDHSLSRIRIRSART